jgi:Glutaminase
MKKNRPTLLESRRMYSYSCSAVYVFLWKVLKPEAVRDVLSLMYSCGMYNYSGQFAFKVLILSNDLVKFRSNKKQKKNKKRKFYLLK